MRASRVPATLLLFLLALAELRASRSNDEEKEKATQNIINVCDIRDRNSKLHCYCELNQEINRASKTECWVFNGGIEKSDPVWTSFSTQTNIETLAFNVRADGALKFVPTKVLRYLQKLKKISIKFSSITEVEENTFINLTYIEEITMIKNEIEYLSKHSFNNLPHLSLLILDENNIKELVTDTFYKTPNLQKLYFTSNNISIIQDGAFRHLVNLLELELDKNNISELRKECFEGLAKLKRLDLSHNKISVLNSFTFTELWNLELLLLHYNDISIVAQRSFDGLSQLKKLNLSHNNLIILAGELFAGVRGLLGLDLRYNILKRFTFDDVNPIYENLLKENSYIYLEGNELLCDCHLAWMHKLRHETKSIKTRTSLENFICKLSPDLALNSQLALFEKNVISPNNNYNIDDKNADNFDDNSDDIFQDDMDETSAQEVQLVKKENEGTLLQIPIDLLPCPQDVKVTDRTYTYPSQNEAKDYRNLIHSSKTSQLHTNISISFLIFLVLLIILTT
ncbi:connectin-like [Galleria mellonella]|uniref:Connectin-like n=1 Tax=Galleria mellonella TaxID=7137 RepID=A0A6J1WHJ4_GALME|nr:connectin-like [Galleria mellonella]